MHKHPQGLPKYRSGAHHASRGVAGVSTNEVIKQSALVLRAAHGSVPGQGYGGEVR